MNEQDFLYLARLSGVDPGRVRKVHELFESGATVPFIARYRKEATGGLDEVVLIKLRDGIDALQKLHKRRENILESLRERELLTPELENKFNAVYAMDELEDLYLPYKQKRKTRASMAREKGLEPLAKFILAQQSGYLDIRQFVNPGKGVADTDAALSGAMDIIAEDVSENADIRKELRELFQRQGMFAAKVVKSKAAEAAVFRDYFDYSEPAGRVPSHRALAVMRGQEQGFLTMQLRPDKDDANRIIARKIIRNRSFIYAAQLEAALEDAYGRLLLPSLENESVNLLKQKADAEAIAVFVSNLKQLLLEAPLGQKRVIAVDPGFRTGCKVAVLDAQGQLLEHFVIYPENSDAAAAILKACGKFQTEVIAVGNGTAGRETEVFLRQTVPAEIPVISVNESGASIYSAGDVARREFPDLDLTFRSAVSIGRRLQDPLAELIKIDPKSIGVGQYQHDVDQAALKQSLDDAVAGCVNAVGVELNSASIELLTYVSGLGPKLAGNIIDCRNVNGAFKSRAELKKVKGLGPKAFEQCAGFLRVRGAANPLDSSGVHPESYDLVKRMAADHACTVPELMKKAAAGEKIDLARYVSDTTGLPTLQDILRELARPGRDPRPEFKPFAFDENVHSITDLALGMKLPGVVTNVTKFGAFVDIGIHCDGLLHISKMAGHFIRDPQEVVAVHDRLTVTVIEIDRERKRISLSLVD
ncbi:MAG: Tex family protein [Victivallaceae bacterium]|jgi:uncharacterized protein